MKKELRISVILLNWNGLDDTVECLESLLKIDYRKYEIIVVDNNSSGSDVAVLDEKFGAKIRLIRNTENCGFAEGNNIAIREVLKEGKSECVLLLNNDTVVTKDFLTTMALSFSIDDRIGVVGNKVLNIEGKLWSSGIRYLGNLFFINKFVSKSGFVDEVVGCCFLVKQSVFRKVGILDKLLFAYGEETDFCIRSREAGYKIYYDDSSHVTHKVSRSTEIKSGMKVYLLVRSKMILGRRYYSGTRLALFYIYMALYVNYNLLTNFSERMSILRGVGDGYTKNLDIR